LFQSSPVSSQPLNTRGNVTSCSDGDLAEEPTGSLESEAGEQAVDILYHLVKDRGNTS
jgi:predicted ABC-type transport system involved in lysophospholipase L1 biosynthesis ATPase subunit